MYFSIDPFFLNSLSLSLLFDILCFVVLLQNEWESSKNFSIIPMVMLLMLLLLLLLERTVPTRGIMRCATLKSITELNSGNDEHGTAVKVHCSFLF